MKQWIKTQYRSIIYLLLVLFLLYVGLRVYLNYRLKQVIINQVEQFAENNYTLEIGKIDLGIWAFNANIKNLKISKYKTKESSKDKYHFLLSASDVKLKNLYLFELLFHKNLQLNKLLINNPTIVLEYNDTIAIKSKSDSSFFQFYYKLSNIILNNAKIIVNKSSGEQFKLNVQNINYNLKNLLLQIQKIEIDGLNCVNYNFDYTCNISKAALSGFDLNVLLNDMNFKYKDCKVEELEINLKAHSILHQRLQPKKWILQKLKSRNSEALNPLTINKIKFSYQSKFDRIQVKATNFAYHQHELQMENIFFTFRQRNYIESNIRKLSLLGFNVDEYIEQKHSSIKKLYLSDPKVKIVLMVQPNYIKSQISVNDKIGYTIDGIDEFEIKNGAVNLKHQGKNNLKLSAKNIVLNAKKIHPEYFDFPYDNKLVEALDINTGALFFNFATNLYHLKSSSISYNLSTEKLCIDSLKIQSNYNKKAFYTIVKKQIARIDFSLNKLSVLGFNLNNLLNNNKFEGNEIEAKKLSVTFYKDKNVPLRPTDYKRFPQELLYALEYPVKINTIYVKDAELVSEILNPGAGNAAKIIVNHVYAKINHIENVKYKGNFMKINFEGRIAGAGLLKANAIFDMYAKDFSHTVHAEIGSMPFKHLNDFMFDFAGVEIRSGTLDKALIDIKGNNKKLSCKLDLSYHNLSMDILRNHNRKNKKYRNIASILANSIIYNHNPEPGKKLRSSKVVDEYITNKFIIGNWMNTSLKAMLLTTSPSAANALQIENYSSSNDSVVLVKSPNWLKRFLQRKKRI